MNERVNHHAPAGGAPAIPQKSGGAFGIPELTPPNRRQAIRVKMIEEYIDFLLEKSTPQAPCWNIETIRAGGKASWNYVDGCMIHAFLEMYQISGKEAYLNFSREFIDNFVREDGSIDSYDLEEYNLDNINAGKTLFDLYRLHKDEKYRRAIQRIYRQIRLQPRTKEGNFWHKKIYPQQVWCDGFYMAMPFYCLYEVWFNDFKNCGDIVSQFQNAYRLMRDTRNGLYYHAYDSSKTAFWCDPVTGLSSHAWLRAMGWYAMALVDVCEVFGEHKETAGFCRELAKIYKELIDAMIKYQDAGSGMWYQIPNYGGIAPNYLETSGTAIFAYAILKSVRLGLLPEEYEVYGQKAFDGVCEKYLAVKNGELTLGGICLVAGLGNTAHREGTFDYYMKEPIVENDAKGVAPLILAYTEILHRRKENS